MKTKIYSLFNAFLVVSLFFYYTTDLFGQEKVNLTAGLGIPELANIGVKYQNNQTQIGLSVGTLSHAFSEKLFSISGDVYYHFGGFSDLTNVKPWYGRMGVNYLRDESQSSIDKYVILTTRIGRDLNISKKIGVQIDIGAMFQLYHDEIKKKPVSNGWFIEWGSGFESPVLPSLGIAIFYRI